MGVNFYEQYLSSEVDMGVMEKISEAIKDLPEPLAREVLDFAESLKAKSTPQDVLLLEHDRPRIPQSLASLAGGLKKSGLFAGNPLDIQRQLRSESQ